MPTLQYTKDCQTLVYAECTIARNKSACLRSCGKMEVQSDYGVRPMQILKDYIDESYNNRTFCIGGWLASEPRWSMIEESWRERFEYEIGFPRRKAFLRSPGTMQRTART